MTDTETQDTAALLARISELENRERELLATIEEQIDNATINEQMAQVLEDILALCDMGEFQPHVLIDFLAENGTVDFMQYHRDYHQKADKERGKAN